jgi:hypothetical protein
LARFNRSAKTSATCADYNYIEAITIELDIARLDSSRCFCHLSA